MIYEERKEKILEYVNSKEYKLMTVKQIAVLFAVPKEDIKEQAKSPLIVRLEDITLSPLVLSIKPKTKPFERILLFAHFLTAFR